MVKVTRLVVAGALALLVAGVAAQAFAESAGGAGDTAAAQSGEAAAPGDEGTPPAADAAQGGGSLRRSSVMEVNELVVNGQLARSGAVYLYKRTPRRLAELVTLRTTFRDRIIEPVLSDREALEPAPAAVDAGPPPPTAPQAAQPPSSVVAPTQSTPHRPRLHR
jgi:hypothetical protein